MLVNTGKKDKKGNVIYVNKLTGRSETIQRVGYHSTKKTIPQYAFGFIFNHVFKMKLNF